MKPTDKQIAFIHVIEEELPVRFIGLSKQEASDFISKHKSSLKHTPDNYDWVNESQNG